MNFTSLIFLSSFSLCSDLFRHDPGLGVSQPLLDPVHHLRLPVPLRLKPVGPRWQRRLRQVLLQAHDQSSQEHHRLRRGHAHCRVRGLPGTVSGCVHDGSVPGCEMGLEDQIKPCFEGSKLTLQPYFFSVTVLLQRPTSNQLSQKNTSHNHLKINFNASY